MSHTDESYRLMGGAPSLSYLGGTKHTTGEVASPSPSPSLPRAPALSLSLSVWYASCCRHLYADNCALHCFSIGAVITLSTGLQLEIDSDYGQMILAVLPGGQAAASGRIFAGEILTHINGVAVAHLTPPVVGTMLRENATAVLRIVTKHNDWDQTTDFSAFPSPAGEDGDTDRKESAEADAAEGAEGGKEPASAGDVIAAAAKAAAAAQIAAVKAEGEVGPAASAAAGPPEERGSGGGEERAAAAASKQGGVEINLAAAPAVCQARAIHAFEAHDGDELALSVGDIVDVLSNEHEEWWIGT